ncbi:LemA family protein [Luteolibacter algae]|uniref:LemA family protein n=1 Tax=Luteolibacter algae TaxID=454151 RepID=A0ABW5D5I3_9BACT
MTYYLVFGGLAVLAGGVIFFYNRLVSNRNRVREGWSGVEVQLKRRHDLIPRLVEVVSGYSHHERIALAEVMEKRREALTTKSAGDASEVESRLGAGIGKIVAVAEAYPDLKADEGFSQLTEELVTIENELQYARRYYNGAVRELNNAIETFPSNLVAGAFGFQQGEFFEVESSVERLAPKIEINH